MLAKDIPKQQFGFIQSNLYPVYFNIVARRLAICLLAHSVVHPWQSPTKAERLEDYLYDNYIVFYYPGNKLRSFLTQIRDY